MVLPVGPPDSGKSEALAEMAKGSEAVPHVLLDFEEGSNRSQREVLAILASGLERKRRRFGRLEFGLLRTCLLVLQTKLDVDDRRRALAALKKLMRQDNGADASRDVVHEVLIEAEAANLVPEMTSRVVDLVLR